QGDAPVARGTGEADKAAADVSAPDRAHGRVERPHRAGGLQPRTLRTRRRPRPQPVLLLPPRRPQTHPAHPRRRDLERGEFADVLAPGDGPMAYVALLARCYDVLRCRPGPVNAISPPASRQDPGGSRFAPGDAYPGRG